MTDLRPVVGSDENAWGTKLLSWLGVSLNNDGTLIGSQVQTALGGNVPDFRGAAVGTFSAIRDVPGCLGWWSAEQLSALADGAAVSRLEDTGGLGADLVQFTSASQPTKQTYNAKPVLRVAASQFMQASGFGNQWPVIAAFTQPLSLIAVVKPSSSNSGTCLVAGGNATSQQLRMLVHSTLLTIYGLGAAPKGPNICDDSWHVVIVCWEATSYSSYIDGYLIETKNTQASSNGIQNFTIGQVSGGGNQFLGDYAEFGVGGRITPRQAEFITTALASKWGITVGKCGLAAPHEQTTQPNGQACRIWTPQTVVAA